VVAPHRTALRLTPLAEELLAKSEAEVQREQRAEEARRQKELEDARKLAESAQARARAERRGRLVTIGMLIAALILVVVLSYDPIRRAWLRQQAMGTAMVNIQEGDYLLGDQQRTEEYPDGYLIYQTYHIHSFSLDPYPVTNRRYGFCIKAGICSRPNALQATYEGEANADKPVVNVTAIDAAEFCNWIGQLLPSDKEWELTASKTGNILPIRDSRYPADFFLEWTRSPYDQNEPEWTDPSKDPPEALTQKGGYLDQPLEQVMTFRQNTSSTFSEMTTGFRCVLDH